MQLDVSVRPSRQSRRQRRLLLVLAVLAAVLVAPGIARSATYISPGLQHQAEASPKNVFKVVIVANRGIATSLVRNARSKDGSVSVDKFNRGFSVINGISANVSGKHLLELARLPFISSITPDTPMRQLGVADRSWPAAVGADKLWGTPDPLTGVLNAPQAPAIAIVDSGVAVRNNDFGSRVVASVNLASGSPLSVGDDYGHGTLVAGLAAGASSSAPGVAQNAPIVSLDVVNGDGTSLTSDVIAAADWIYLNRDLFGIRVANFSLRSANPDFGVHDPLNAAVRRLWLTGTVVVASAGNDGPQRMLYAPASDPFVITVGAVDAVQTPSPFDDVNAPWSSFGRTAEGFSKPEVTAPGRYAVAPLQESSTLWGLFPDRVVSPGYVWMSGTSFSAPVVSGLAAQILARNPTWSPDQVKGALMLTAHGLSRATPLSAGVGEVDGVAAASVDSPPNPNAALEHYVRHDLLGVPYLDGDAWNAAVAGGTWQGQLDASWTDASWTDASWTDASWTDASWTDASWTDASWTDASWTDASWTDASWTDASWTDASWTDASWTDASWTDGTPIE